MQKTLSLFVLAALTSSAMCWWNDGHIMVARIAYDVLKKNNPSVLNQAQSLLDVLTVKNPSLITSEGDYSFVESATFADDIKPRGFKWQDPWHFVDYPYFDQGGDMETFPKFKLDPQNVTAVIPVI